MTDDGIADPTGLPIGRTVGVDLMVSRTTGARASTPYTVPDRIIGNLLELRTSVAGDAYLLIATDTSYDPAVIPWHAVARIFTIDNPHPAL